MTLSEMLTWALAYCEAGLSVIPLHGILGEGRCTCGNPSCDRAGKHPSVASWAPLQKKPMLPEEIKKHWSRYPNHNVAIGTGENSGCYLLDEDGPKGVEILKSHGITPESWDGPVSETGGGGHHFYVKYEEGLAVKNAVKILPGVDIRGEAGYAVAPPSRHASGEIYRWVPGKSILEVSFPSVNLEEILGIEISKKFPIAKITVSSNGNKKNSQWYLPMLDGVPEGTRNVCATRLVGRWLRNNTAPEAFLLFERWNQNNNPCLPDEELQTIFKSVSEKERSRGSQEMTHEESMEFLCEILDMEVLLVNRILGDSPKYILKCETGNAQMTTTVLLNPVQFQRAILDATGIVPPKFDVRSNPTLDSVAQLISNVAIDVEAGEESTGLGETKNTLIDMAKSERPAEVNLIEVPPQGMFLKDGKIWFSLRDLAARLNGVSGTKVTQKDLAQELAKYGFERETFSTESGQRTAWGISTNKLDLEGVL